MNEKIVLRLLLFLMVPGLLAIMVIPAAHIGEVGLTLGKFLTGGIVAILIYLSLRNPTSAAPDGLWIIDAQCGTEIQVLVLDCLGDRPNSGVKFSSQSMYN
jgi:hypothetical protein